MQGNFKGFIYWCVLWKCGGRFEYIYHKHTNRKCEFLFRRLTWTCIWCKLIPVSFILQSLVLVMFLQRAFCATLRYIFHPGIKASLRRLHHPFGTPRVIRPDATFCLLHHSSYLNGYSQDRLMPLWVSYTIQPLVSPLWSRLYAPDPAQLSYPSCFSSMVLAWQETLRGCFVSVPSSKQLSLIFHTQVGAFFLCDWAVKSDIRQSDALLGEFALLWHCVWMME